MQNTSTKCDNILPQRSKTNNVKSRPSGGSLHFTMYVLLLTTTVHQENVMIMVVKKVPVPFITGHIAERRQPQENLTPRQYARLKRGSAIFRNAAEKIDDSRKARH